MPATTVPPFPWKYTIDLFDAFESTVRSESLAAGREVLDKNREVIDLVRELAESEDQTET